MMRYTLISISLFNLFLYGLLSTTEEVIQLPNISLNEVQKRTHRYHFLLGLDSTAQDLIRSVAWFYRNESSLVVGMYEQSRDTSIPWEKQTNEVDKLSARVVFFKKQTIDRTCLLTNNTMRSVQAVAIVKDTIGEIIEFLNENCFFFVTVQDELDKAGQERSRILKNLYRVPLSVEKNKVKCERISMPQTSIEFVRNFLYQSKPVIIENAMLHWDALNKWSNDYLRTKYQDMKVHVKLTPDGEFEGCDRAEKFNNFGSFKVPDAVKRQLLFPDLVVVRPAVGNLKFGEFLDLIESKDKSINISAYLEYSSIREYFPDLEYDLDELPFINDILTFSHLNIWLSNGNTLGKLHFDPFDNFLCQIRGNKRLTIYDPHNNYNLYEAHIQEAMLGFDSVSKKFSAKKLLDSTSMVMSPIDILNPDFDRFPNFTRANSMECYLNEGDILYLPAYWWHEVQSYPNPIEKRNLAVNFWYQPFLTKEFPCPECKLDVNQMYRKLLKMYT